MNIKDANVLVVEDDSHTLQCERLILEGGGYKVASATSGEEAINMVADLSPDLVLLDIGLPDIDGFTTCKVIRKFSQVPIIIVTGSGSSADKVRGLDLGADDYITKPFTEGELFARSKAVLRRSTSGYKSPHESDCPCGKPSRRGSPGDLPDKLRAIYLLVRRFYRSLADQLKSRLDARHAGGGEGSQWLAFIAGAKVSVRRASGYSIAKAASLALYCQTIARRAGNSPPVSRAKASRPAVKLGEATARLLVSAPVNRAYYAGSMLWTCCVFNFTRILDSFRKDKAGPLDGTTDLDNGKQDSLGQQPVALLHAPELNGGQVASDVAAPAHQMAFLEELLRAYLKVAGTLCNDPMISAPVVPLVGVYEQMVASASVSAGYSQEQFTRDVYHLHRGGLDTTPTGARVQFPISRGVPNKILMVTDETGHEVRYYGIRFMPARNPDSVNCPVSLPFDSSAADRYSKEIKEVLARQLEWPSEEFVRFWADQINLGALNQKDARQLAQITRDSLQQFIQELR